jgi:hypothetical protein
MLKSAFFLTTLFLFLFLNNLNATNYYLSTGSSGGGAGTSWATAKIYTSFNWGATSFVGGDTVFFDGGSSGITYNHIAYIANVHPTSQVVITKGKDTGHNGGVTFIPYDYTIGWAFQLNTCSNIKLTNLSFKCLLTAVTTETKILYLKSGHHNVIDNCIVESGGDGSGIVLYAEALDTIKNCTITIDDNNNPNIQDAIRFENGGAGGDVVIGNYISMKGRNSIPHKDVLQTAGIGSSYNYQTIFANNFVWVHAPQTDEYQGLFFADFVSGGSNRFLVYNNIFIMDAWKNNQPIIIQGNNGNSHQSLRVFNNTIVLGNSTTARFLMCGNIDTLIAKNNIVSADSGIQFMYGLYNDASNYNNIPYKDIGYNQLWARGGIGTKMYGGGYTYNFGGWKALGYDAHSDTGMVSFVKKWGTNATDYKLVTGSKGIGGAIDLSTYFTTDILGAKRPKGASWDMGAFQYSSGVGGGGGGALPTSTLNLTALIETVIAGIPMNFAISQNYPNPFNPSTKINYQVPNDSRVILEVYNIAGQKVAELVNQDQSAGYYTVDFGTTSKLAS